jgi:MerR family transcriptional regulator, thiopeptide resistance regulator
LSRTYQIHEFARRANVTVRALHHYDRLGLLKPSGRTSAGYRLYSDRDLVRLEQIVALKFIGFPLVQIRDILNRNGFEPSAALRQQGRILRAKRHHIDRAIRAIELAEKAIAAGRQRDWEPFRKIIEVIQVETRKEWMSKYFTEDQLEDLRNRFSPERKAESDRAWAVLANDTEKAIAQGEAPSGKTGQQLATRRQKLFDQFTAGDPGLKQSVRKLYADKENWPANFKMPFSEAVHTFLEAAGKALAKN